VPVGRIVDVLSNMVYGDTSINDFTGPSKPAEVQDRDILDLLFHGTPRARRAAAPAARDRTSRPLTGLPSRPDVPPGRSARSLIKNEQMMT
jgi:hypothetical protein